jgi:hypothetical protein
MGSSVSLALIQQAIRSKLSELGFGDLTSRRTSLLIQRGYCVGWRLVFDGVQAVWFLAEEVVRFYDESGQMLASVAVGSNEAQNRAA